MSSEKKKELEKIEEITNEESRASKAGEGNRISKTQMAKEQVNESNKSQLSSIKP
jgi:hypothetical protein